MSTTEPPRTSQSPLNTQQKIAAVIVTHHRVELLRASLEMVAQQTYPLTHIIVVDNGNEPEVKVLVEEVAGERGVYLGSQTNFGGGGGFAYGFMTALAMGADAVWCADDDGRPASTDTLETLLTCAEKHSLYEVSPVVVNADDPEILAFPLRRGLVWRRNYSELKDPTLDPKDTSSDLLPSIASLFNGALFSAKAIERIGVPDYRLFIRGDEVEYHRRLVRSGLAFGTCLDARYLHPDGASEFHPILGGKMHAQYPDNDAKRFFTYRNRGYIMNQPGMKKLLPQEYARFAWFFLVKQRDIAGFKNWLKLQRLGRKEQFLRPGEDQ